MGLSGVFLLFVIDEPSQFCEETMHCCIGNTGPFHM